MIIQSCAKQEAIMCILNEAELYDVETKDLMSPFAGIWIDFRSEEEGHLALNMVKYPV